MGFSFKLKKPSLKGLVKGFVYSGGGILPGIGEAIAGSEKAEGVVNTIMGGVGNLVTGGYLAQKDATEEAKKARDQAQKQYAAEQMAAEETARKIAETEEERKRRLAMQGTQTPSTLLNSYLGVSGGASVRRSVLG